MTFSISDDRESYIFAPPSQKVDACEHNFLELKY